MSLTFEAGRSYALVGRSGSGKSSLMGLLSTMRRPTSGAVVIGGVDVAAASPEDLADLRRSTVGVMFQSFHLQGREQVWRNVCLPASICGSSSGKTRRQRAQGLMESVGLDPGLADRPARTLSGGQRQRVALARALWHQPQLLIADEPTGSLDEDTAEHVAQLIFGLAARGTTVVVVTHDRHIALMADRTVELAHGRVIESGV